MIVSFSRSFAFVAIPRTGTHTVRAALRPHLAPSDWEQCTRFEPRLCPAPHIAALGHGHLTARELRDALIPGLWERMTTFAFVRDPLARFQSAYFLRNRTRGEDAAQALAGMKRVLADPAERGHVLYRTQADFLRDDDGTLMVDVIARCEVIDRDLPAICERLGLPPARSARINAARYPAGHAPDAELAAMVRELYADDYALIAALAERAG